MHEPKASAKSTTSHDFMNFACALKHSDPANCGDSNLCMTERESVHKVHQTISRIGSPDWLEVM